MAKPPKPLPQRQQHFYYCPLCEKMVTGLTRHLQLYHGGCKYRGIEMRSSWELGVAKLLDQRGLRWAYEDTAFRLSDGRIYLPDFHVFPPDGKDYYIEVKGRWIGLARRKFMQFQKEYPDVIVSLWTGRVLRSYGVLPAKKKLR